MLGHFLAIFAILHLFGGVGAFRRESGGEGPKSGGERGNIGLGAGAHTHRQYPRLRPRLRPRRKTSATRLAIEHGAAHGYMVKRGRSAGPGPGCMAGETTPHTRCPAAILIVSGANLTLGRVARRGGGWLALFLGTGPGSLGESICPPLHGQTHRANTFKAEIVNERASERWAAIEAVAGSRGA